MPDEMKPYNPSLRERLAAALRGDSKPGSIREQLVTGLVGSPVEGGAPEGNMPLVDFSPLGIVFAKDEAERALDKGQYGKAALNAVGLIPAAGPEVRAALQALHPTEQKVVETALKAFLGSEPQANSVGLSDILDAAQYARRSFNPKQQKLLDSAIARLTPENPVIRGTIIEHDAVPSNSAAGKDRQMNLDDLYKDMEKQGLLEDRREYTPEDLASAYGLSKNDASKLYGRIQAEFTPHYNSNEAQYGTPEEIEKFITSEAEKHAGGDPHKLNYIKNAMMDEGGNVPEEVADALVQTLGKRQDAHNILQHDLDLHPDISDEDLKKFFLDTHSVPEMLSFNYDLDPSLKNAYQMPGRPTRKPTQ